MIPWRENEIRLEISAGGFFVEIDFHTSVKAEQFVRGSLRKGKQDLMKCLGIFITRSALVRIFYQHSADFFRADVSSEV